MKILAGAKIYEYPWDVAMMYHEEPLASKFWASTEDGTHDIELSREIIRGKRYRFCTYDKCGDIVCEDLHIGVDKYTQEIIDMIVKVDVNHKIDEYKEEARVNLKDRLEEVRTIWVNRLTSCSWKGRLMYFLTSKVKYLNVKEN